VKLLSIEVLLKKLLVPNGDCPVPCDWPETLSLVLDGDVKELCDDASLVELLRLLVSRSLAGDGALSEPEGERDSLMLVTRPLGIPLELPRWFGRCL
jgi:hypothetical protein